MIDVAEKAVGALGGTGINDLPDSSFAYIEPGGQKDADGRTTPRSLRHFPIRDANGKPDAAHVRNALSRLPQSDFESKARAKVEAAARELSIGEPASKAFTEELKAEPFTTDQYDRWLSGRMPRRILMLPFGGPLQKAGAPDGADLDGEWFSSRTDLYDGKPILMQSRIRVVDWHHDKTPPRGAAPQQASLMKGALLGHLVFDELPEDEGIWADWWAKAGERRLRMVAALERHEVPLFGSSKAAYKAVDPETGEVLTWPLIAHTISTSPQNTRAVVPPLKALLSGDELDDVPAEAIKALLTGVGANERDLLLTFLDGGGDGAAKAGRVLSAVNEAALRRALEELGVVLSKLVNEDAAPSE